MESEQQKKIFLIKVGVISLTALILILWIFNLPNVWHDDQKYAATGSQNDEWQQLKTDLDKTLASLNELNQRAASQTNITAIAGNAMLSDVLTGAKKLASTTAATTTIKAVVTKATSTKAIGTPATSTPK